MTGSYVALEGIEGAGKSTVAVLLDERLRDRGVDVVSVREPGGTAVGERIRRVLLDPEGTMEPWTEALLFAAARSQLAREVVGPALAEGKTVLSDRSVYSSLAYQGGGRALGLEAVRRVNEAALGGIWPDRVVLLQVDAETGMNRERDRDRIGSEGVALQRRVAGVYGELAAAEPGRFIVVDASRDLAEVVAEIEGVLI
ncbi:MAG: dTMP kinase [Acidimicrobiia bacterium]